jgi:hypothetical protein
MPKPFNVRGGREHKERNKTNHDTAIIKPPLQQHNDPQLDHPCPSFLNNFIDETKEKGRGLLLT